MIKPVVSRPDKAVNIHLTDANILLFILPIVFLLICRPPVGSATDVSFLVRDSYDFPVRQCTAQVLSSLLKKPQLLAVVKGSSHAVQVSLSI